MAKAIAKSAHVRGFEPTEQQFQQVAEIARVDLDGTDEVLAALGADALSRAKFNVLQAGAYFLKLKAQAGHGNFLPALEGAGVGERAAQEAMQIASYVAALPADRARQIAALPKRKILPLINADAEIVGQLLDEGALDGDQALSVRDLRERLAAETKLREKAEKAVEVLSRETGRAKAGKEPLGLLVAREEAMAISERIQAELSIAKLVFDEYLQAEGGDDERWRMDAGGMMYFAMLPAAKQAVELLERLQKRFGVRITGTLHEEFKLPAGSAEKFLAERNSLLERAGTAARERIEARHRKHGLVGRPPSAGKKK